MPRKAAAPSPEPKVKKTRKKVEAPIAQPENEAALRVELAMARVEVETALEQNRLLTEELAKKNLRIDELKADCLYRSHEVEQYRSQASYRLVREAEYDRKVYDLEALVSTLEGKWEESISMNEQLMARLAEAEMHTQEIERELAAKTNGLKDAETQLSWINDEVLLLRQQPTTVMGYLKAWWKALRA